MIVSYRDALDVVDSLPPPPGWARLSVRVEISRITDALGFEPTVADRVWLDLAHRPAPDVGPAFLLSARHDVVESLFRLGYLAEP